MILGDLKLLVPFRQAHTSTMVELKFFLALTATLISTSRGQSDYDVVFSWTPLQFQWPNASFEAAYGDLQASPIGIKAYGDNFYFSMPR